MDDPYLSTVEAATLLGVDRRTVTTWARHGRLPAVRLSANGHAMPLRYRRSDVLALAERRAVEPEAVPIEADPEPAPAWVQDGGLITTMEAAELLGVNRATIVNWARQGRFPALQYGYGGRQGVYRFRRSDIIAYLDDSRVVIAPGDATPDADPDR